MRAHAHVGATAPASKPALAGLDRLRSIEFRGRAGMLLMIGIFLMTPQPQRVKTLRGPRESCMAKYEMRTRDVITHTLGTLAPGDFILGATKIDATRLQGCRVQKMHSQIHYEGLTALDGSLLFGVSNALTVGELAEWRDADPQFEGDPEEEEKSQRHAITLGAVQNQGGGTSSVSGDGPWRTHKGYPWDIIEGTTFNTWVQNIDTSALQTAGVVRIFLECLGVWLRD